MLSDSNVIHLVSNFYGAELNKTPGNFQESFYPQQLIMYMLQNNCCTCVVLWTDRQVDHKFFVEKKCG